MDEATPSTSDQSPALSAVMKTLELSWVVNHREHPRIATRSPLDDSVTIVDPDRKMHWTARLLDISAGGIGARSDYGPLSPGTYAVSFPLPFKDKIQWVTANMKLAYCVTERDLGGYRVGFQLQRIEA